MQGLLTAAMSIVVLRLLMDSKDSKPSSYGGFECDRKEKGGWEDDFGSAEIIF